MILMGGKIPVIGALESRGVEFDGVIILDFNDGVCSQISHKKDYISKLKF